MKRLAMIACVSSDGGLGKDGDLLWYFKDDMQFFRETTSHHTVVMGRKTFNSIGRPLPNRKNVVLSRQDVSSDVQTFHNETELRKFLKTQASMTFIIGGATLYEMFINDTDVIFLTEVQSRKPADVFFPQFNKTEFERKVLKAYETDGIKFEIVKYTRKAPSHG